MVWIPVGNKGALVALGGTAFTLAMSTAVGPPFDNKSEANALKTQGQNFMTEIVVYDVDGDKWYTQSTSGGTPPPTAEFCSVVASSDDESTHHVSRCHGDQVGTHLLTLRKIYVYGGYNGLTYEQYSNLDVDSESPVNDYDDVWVLSIPSFTWTKVYSGQNSNARRAHRCHRVADNQMMVIGGVGASATCVRGGFVRTFDLNELKFLDNYDPNGNKNYQIPTVVTNNM
jgi:hypothetical protein